MRRKLNFNSYVIFFLRISEILISQRKVLNVNIKQKIFRLKYIQIFTENIGQGRTFSENTQLSVNESFYLGALLVVNTLVLIAVIFLLWTPQLRFCSLFGNCDSTSGEYPAGVGHNLQDPRMINNYNMYPTTSYARSLQKR